MGLSNEISSTMTEQEDEIGSICVVTQPLGNADVTATGDILEILSAITSVSLITIALPDGSTLRDDYETIELSKEATQGKILFDAVQFVLNQYRMAREIRRRPEPTILFYGSMTYILPIVVSRLSGKTVITEPRADVPISLQLQWEQKVPKPIAAGLARVVRLLERTGYRLSDGIIAYSPGMAEQLNLFVYEEKLYTNGARFIDTETFSVETPFEERSMTVGFVGRLAEEKGIRTLAEVARRLPSEITFRFVGDGPLRSWLHEELEDEIASGAVETEGWVQHDEVPRELNKLRLLVMASEPTEGLPTAILESMACGTPVYTTPVSGVVDVVKEGETGIWMMEEDPKSIANRIVQAMNGDLAEYSNSGYQLIREKYTYDDAVSRYGKILRGVTD